MVTAYQRDLLDMGKTIGFNVINNDGTLVYGKLECQPVNGIGVLEFPDLGYSVFVLSTEKTINNEFKYPNIKNLLIQSADPHNSTFHNSYISCNFNYLYTDKFVYNITKQKICLIKNCEPEDKLLHFTEFFQLGRNQKIKIIANYNKTGKKRRAYSHIINAIIDICELAPMPYLYNRETYAGLLKYYEYNNNNIIKPKEVIWDVHDIINIPEYLILERTI